MISLLQLHTFDRLKKKIWPVYRLRRRNQLLPHYLINESRQLPSPDRGCAGFTTILHKPPLRLEEADDAGHRPDTRGAHDVACKCARHIFGVRSTWRSHTVTDLFGTFHSYVANFFPRGRHIRSRGGDSASGRRIVQKKIPGWGAQNDTPMADNVRTRKFVAGPDRGTFDDELGTVRHCCQARFWL